MKIEYKVLLIIIFMFFSVMGIFLADLGGKKFLDAEKTIKNEVLSSVFWDRYEEIKDISCVPYSIGHPEEADNQLFSPILGVKNCNNFKQGTMKFSEDKVEGSCPDRVEPVFLIGLQKENEKFGKTDLNFTEVRGSAADIKGVEYFGMRCGKKGKGNIALRNLPSYSVMRRAQDLEETADRKGNKRNLTVILLVLDSVSRQSFYRNLKSTSEVLRGLKNSEKFLVYDFIFSHAIYSKTLPNIIPMLTGYSLENLKSSLLNASLSDEKSIPLFKSNEKKAIWNSFKSNGFVTQFSYDTVSEYLSTIFGRSISADHVLSNFWHLSNQLFSYTDFNENSQCIAGHPPHFFSLSYMKDFISNYPRNNKFLYTHLSVAHEKSGKRLSTADEDLTEFIKWVLSEHESKNLAFFIMSDHGRPGASPVMLDSRAESTLSLTLLIASREVVSHLKGQNFLKKNTKKMVSRYDLYKTIRTLADFPYEDYQGLLKKNKQIYTEFPGLNLFFEEISADRDCKEAGVQENFCFCTDWKEFSGEWEKNEGLNFIIKSGLDYQNGQRSNNENCQPVKIDSVLSIKYYMVEKNNEMESTHYLVNIRTDQNTRFEVLGSTASAEKYENLNSNYYLPLTHRYLYSTRSGEQTYMIAKVWRIKGSSFCIKQGIKDFKIVQSKGNSCEESCRALGLACETPTFSNDFLSGLSQYGNIHDTEQRSLIQKHGPLILITNGDHCGSPHLNIIHLCNCVKNITILS